MSRRGGGRGRDHASSSWSKSSHSNAPSVPRPRGLRGRDIGLFYRDLAMQKKTKTHKEVIIRLTIPPGVISGLETNIQTIRELARVLNIPVSPFKGLTFVKTEKKEDTTKLSPAKSRKLDSMTSPSTSTACSSTQEFKKPNDVSFDTKEIKMEDIKDELVDYTSDDDDHDDDDDDDDDAKEMIKNIKIEQMEMPKEKLLSLRGAGDFKYGYKDIITETFEEKLNECLSKGITIKKNNSETEDLNEALYQDYKSMLETPDYKVFMQFRETLPTYKKSVELLEIINKHQVVVISGETGCGKSTQIPQLILDEAMEKKRGAFVKILVTQPRRIAASSLALRVAQERVEQIGASVGYAVRLEKIDPRPRGSIMFCTTGILLATLEVDQGLTNYTHIILDEVHERDCDIDLAMFMLTKVLKKRKDLKLILMSATIDAETLSAYFNKCPMIHIDGLAYPVKDLYLEEILEITKYTLPQSDRKVNTKHNRFKYKKNKASADMEKDIHYKAEIAPWLESIKRQIHYDVYKSLQDYRIEELNIDLILELLIQICKGPPGAVLIFLPGIADISKLLRKMQTGHHFPSTKYEIHPLHSKLPSIQQHKIFEKPKGKVRKIIIATNIAETSITIDDIVYVIDSGRMKYSGLNVERNFSTLQVEWISQANLRQRRGRAGRCQPGTCYHLLTSYRASKLEERILPELQRNSLLEPVLAIKRLRLGIAADAFALMPAPPADTTVQLAVKHLEQCGALDLEEKLTPLGWHLARLPVHPAAGKLLLLGAMFGCLDRAASVAAVWGFKDPFLLVIGKEDEADQAKKFFALGEGSDHVAISEAIIQWENQPSQYERMDFAHSNFLANNTLDLLSDMKRQLGGNLKQMGFLPSGDIQSPWENRNMDNLSLFKAVVAAALYPNVATTKWTNLNSRNPNKVIGIKARTQEDGHIFIHPSSVMAAKRPKTGYPTPLPCTPGANWLVYWHKQRSTELYLLEVTVINTLPLLFFGELTISEADNPEDCYISIASIKVWCRRHTAALLVQMKSLLDQVLAAKIGINSTHSTTHNTFEEHVLNAVKELITAEDGQAEYLNDDDDFSESDNSEYESNKSWRRY